MGSDNLITEARSGELEAIKGNYNEALLLQMIYETKSDVIQIDKKYQKNKKNISKKIKTICKKDLKNYTQKQNY